MTKHTAYQKVRRRWAQGCEPTSNRLAHSIGTPERFTLQRWLEFRAANIGVDVPQNLKSFAFAEFIHTRIAIDGLSITEPRDDLEPKLLLEVDAVDEVRVPSDSDECFEC